MDVYFGHPKDGILGTPYGRPFTTSCGHPNLTSLGEDISISFEHPEDVHFGYPTGPRRMEI